MAIEIDWTKDQARLILSSILERLQKEPTSFTVSIAGNELHISKKDIGEWIKVILHRRRSGIRHFFSVGDYCGHAPMPSFFFWQDVDYKQVIKMLWDRTDGRTSDKITEHLHKFFPEMTRIEFEKQVLNPPQS